MIIHLIMKKNITLCVLRLPVQARRQAPLRFKNTPTARCAQDAKHAKKNITPYIHTETMSPAEKGNKLVDNDDGFWDILGKRS